MFLNLNLVAYIIGCIVPVAELSVDNVKKYVKRVTVENLQSEVVQ